MSFYKLILLFLLTPYLYGNNQTINHRSTSTYFIDATYGNDTNNGKSKKYAWRSTTRIKNLKLFPGDKVLFKRGEVWNNTQLINYHYPSGTKKKSNNFFFVWK